MGETILRSQVIREINSGNPFNLHYVTGDKHRQTGGDYVRLTGYRKLTKETAAGPARQTPYQPAKDLSHDLHSTFICFDPARRQDHMRTVHYRLVVNFNGKTVLNG